MSKRLVPIVGLTFVLSGCSFWKEPEFKTEAPSVATTIKNLPTVEVQSQELPTLSLSELVTQLEQVQTDEHQFEVTSRLAQLQLELMEYQLSTGETDFTALIQTLEKLRDLTDNEQVKARVDYQLARVKSMSGEQDTVLASLSETIATTDVPELELESRFRRAEIRFSNADLKGSEQDFAKVASTTGEYQLHARYMLTWVRFKLGDLDGSLEASIAALSQIEMLEEKQKYQELKRDLSRVTVLALDYADGPETLAELMEAESKPDWQTDLYRALGDWYLTKDRFADSALTWQTFLTENPLHADAPDIALEVINTQREAGFVADIPNLERDFILGYGKQTEFYAIHGDDVFANYEVTLRDMLDRYSQRLHNEAQESDLNADYELAATGYDIWLTNFAETDAGQEKRFLYAEVLQRAFGFARAYIEFEEVIATDFETEFGREAAYAVVLGLSESLASFGVDSVIEANLRFSAFYPTDERASAAQLNAAKHLFEESRFAETMDAAQVALQLESSPDKEYQLVAKRLIAHSAFELEDYARAERVYKELGALGEDHQTEILAAVFKQAEVAELSGDLTTAISHYKRLEQIAPNSQLASDAAYDVVALYEQLGQTALAVNQLTEYRNRYPNAAKGQQDEISRRLIDLKEASGDLMGAATELVSLSKTSSGEASRVARYRAAELYLEAGSTQQAIEHFRFYAHNFLEPASIRLEAMHHMDELYQVTNEPSKRNFWLRKKRDLFKQLPEVDRTGRARYLAANAIFTLNEETFTAYKRAKLTAPLARSLKKKQSLLAKSLSAYEAVVKVGEFEYATMSYLRMAKHYELLAEELLATDAPKGLNELEQEQYLILLEEQAFPFEEKAIALHRQNLSLGWQSGWNQSVNESLLALQKLSPAQFRRPEQEVAYVLSGD